MEMKQSRGPNHFLLIKRLCTGGIVIMGCMGFMREISTGNYNPRWSDRQEFTGAKQMCYKQESDAIYDT